MPAFVSLVGAGPGDPDLLTVKAVRALQQAEVILFDALVGAGIQALFPAEAECVYVGKRCGKHSQGQTEINALIIGHALRGKRVVRLKGGDPFIFGRGGEELIEIKKHGIGYEIIPGITAAVGAACYAELPLTHRGVSDEVRIVTGHKFRTEIASLAHCAGTVVLYMGVAQAGEHASQLLAAGARPERPLALVENACLPGQTLSFSTLGEAAVHGLSAKTTGPGLLIIGEVVHLFHPEAQAAT